jgi:SulP family sulfate permease
MTERGVRRSSIACGLRRVACARQLCGGFSFSLVTGALAIAAIVLVQGAGVAEAAPNEDGTPSDANQDIIAQGARRAAPDRCRASVAGG